MWFIIRPNKITCQTTLSSLFVFVGAGSTFSFQFTYTFKDGWCGAGCVCVEGCGGGMVFRTVKGTDQDTGATEDR